MNEAIQKLIDECNGIQDVVSSLVDDAKKEDPIAVEKLQAFLLSTRDFSQFIATSAQNVDCELPYHSHPIKFRYYRCVNDRRHVFCKKHDLDFCPKCGALVR